MAIALKEDILGHLLRRTGIARNSECDAVDPALMPVDELLEALLSGGHVGFLRPLPAYTEMAEKNDAKKRGNSAGGHQAAAEEGE